MKIRALEIFLIEVVIYLFLWLSNDYLASLLSVIIAAIFLLILLISLIVEWVERSKVPKLYYQFMAVSVIAPFVAALLFFLFGGEITWLRDG